MIEIKITDVTQLSEKEIDALSQFFTALKVTDSAGKLEHIPTPPQPQIIVEEFSRPGMASVGSFGNSQHVPLGVTAEIPQPQEVPPLPLTIEVDSTGAEWDAEIHSRTKRKDKNGEWLRLKKTTTPILPEAPTPAPLTFEDIMLFVTNALATNQIDPPAVERILKAHNLVNLPELLRKPELFQTVLDSFKRVVSHAE